LKLRVGERPQPGLLLPTTRLVVILLGDRRRGTAAGLHEVAPLQQRREEDKIGDTTTSARSPMVKSLEETTLVRIPPENTGAPHLEARKAKGRGGRKRIEA
jgi:hypothetical protein